MVKLPDSITIYEVGPRDGLQFEATITTQDKLAFISALSQSGLQHIEAGAFVSAKWIPQMADTEALFSQLPPNSNVRYSALTPNLKGAETAIAAGVKEIAVFTAASEGFSQHNINCSIEQSIERFLPVIELAQKHSVLVRGYLSCIHRCPYDGLTPVSQVSQLTRKLLDIGCYQVSLGDTLGTSNPIHIATLLEELDKTCQLDQLAMHFHDTWGQALANIYQSITMGITTFDSSTAGLGGCPYAIGASGNVATEDVLFLCKGLGIDTGVDINKVAEAGWKICEILNKPPLSKASVALLGQKKAATT